MRSHWMVRGLSALALWGGLACATFAQQSRAGLGMRPTTQASAANAVQAGEEIDSGVVPIGTTMENMGYSPNDLDGDSYATSLGRGNYGILKGMYFRGEYLLWSLKGMDTPPLVTTGSTTGANSSVAGFVNENGSLGVNTQVLFGNEAIHGQGRNGGRLTFGFWLDQEQRLALEGDYFALRDYNTQFDLASTGTTLIARPYYDETLGGTPNTFDIAGPTVGNAAGSVSDQITTRFQGAGARALYTMCCNNRQVSSLWDGCAIEQCTCVRLIGGYRFLRLDDGIVLQETHLVPNATRTGMDRFDSENQFHGADFGTAVNFRRGRWTMDLLSKVAVGNTQSRVNIDGTARYNDVLSTTRGSTLATTSNIGTYEHQHFTMVPELGMTVGYQIVPGLRATVGYSVLYWSSVYRAGDQIDLHVNPDLWPNPASSTTAGQWPQYPGRQTDFWAQGLSLGLEGQW